MNHWSWVCKVWYGGKLHIAYEI